MKKRLIFGTANLGFNNYGISSHASRSKSENILDTCVSLNIKDVDTSPKYGSSEKIIGTFLKKNKTNFNIHTKLPLPENEIDISCDFFKRYFEKSLNNTNTNIIEVLYLHNNQIKFLSHPIVNKFMIDLKSKGLVKKIGATVYTLKELEYTVKNNFFDVIQLPLNLANFNIFKNIIKKYPKKELFVRSIFLQGALSNNNFQFPNKDFIDQLILFKKKFNIILINNNLCLPELCFKFIMAIPNINGIIFGTHSRKNLVDIHKWSNEKITLKVYNEVIDALGDINFSYHDPRFW